MSDVRDEVKNYYANELQKSDDLKTNACCTIVTMPDEIKNALINIHDEVTMKYYGCGLTIPTELKGMKVLDLGSGSGRDCYLLSQLVGEEGEVVGVDMTDAQLEVANKHIDWHTKKFGYKSSNVRFIKGYLEDLDKLDIPDNYFDIIVSNCVINLVKDKEKVFKNAFQKLKVGGEMYFSDVYADRRVPKHLQDDPVLYGECLSGSLYWNDFMHITKKVGFTDPRTVESAPITIQNKEIETKLKGYEFRSVTTRLFKLNDLDDICEDYGQAVKYKGGIPSMEHLFSFDRSHAFEKGRIERVCGNTYKMLEETRLKDYFDFYGDFEVHYGQYPSCDTFAKPEFNKGQSSEDQANACC